MGRSKGMVWVEGASAKPKSEGAAIVGDNGPACASAPVDERPDPPTGGYIMGPPVPRDDHSRTPRCDILGVPSLIVEPVTITVARGGMTLFERTVNASLAGQDRIVHYLTLGVSKPSRRNKRVRKAEKGEP